MKVFASPYVLIFVLLLCGCSGKEQEPVLTESEIAFNEMLASITKDDIEQNIYYIGTEDGIVYRYNSESNHIDTLKTPYDRIYKVYRSKDKTTYWIGTRNQGLVRCVLVGDSLFMEEGAYTIPAKNKARKYSAYDIFKKENETFVATSHGLFVIEDITDSAMRLLYPNIDKSHQDTLRPVVASKIQAFDDSLIFCASDSGLLKFDMTKGTIATRIPIKPVKSLEILGKEIRLLTDSFLCIVDKDGELIGSALKLYLEHPANTYFYERNEGVNYLIGERNAQLIKDDDWSKPSEHKNVRLKYKVRSSTCRNVIANDVAHHQSLMVSESSLVRIGHHQNVFNSIGKVDHVCVDGKFVYFLIGSKLYRQDTMEKNSLKAEHICNLKIKGKGVSFLEVHNGVVYYVSDDKKQIFKKELKSNFFFNELFSSEESLENMLGKEVTAIGKDGRNVYVGIRDGLQNVNKEEALQLYANSISREICPDPFITAMTDTLSGGDILLGTLNDGLYRGKDNTFKRLGDFKESFIRDVAVNKDDSRTFVLTNRKLFVYGANPDSVIIKEAQGYNRILIASHPYGLKENGIHDFETGMDFFIDVQFNPQACVALNGYIYAGSSNGVYVFKGLETNECGKKGYSLIDFEPENEPIQIPYLIFFCLLILLLIAAIYLWYRHYRIRKSIPTLLKNSQESAKETERKESLERIKARLRNRIQEQLQFKDFLDDDISQNIETICATIDELGIQGNEGVQEEANKLNRDIQQLSFRIPTILNMKLEEQIKVIQDLKNGEENAWCKETDEVRKGNDISTKANQIRKNIIRIKDTQETILRLADYSSLFKDLAIISEITEDSIAILESDKTSKEKVTLLEKQLRQIETGDTKEKMLDYISNKINKIGDVLEELDAKTIYNNIIEGIKDEYLQIGQCINDAEKPFLEILKQIPAIDNHLSTILILIDIQRLIHKRQYAAHKGFDKDIKAKFIEDFQEKINKFYEIVWNCRDRYLLDLLEIKAKKSEGQFMDANVLALIMADVEISNKEIKDILLVNDQRARTTRRELIKSIDSHRKEVGDYAEVHPSSFAVLLLVVADSAIK